jgi:hypothetical protein
MCLNTFGQGEYSDNNVQKMFDTCIGTNEQISHVEKCNCHLNLSDTLNKLLISVYSEKEHLLTKSLQNESFQNDPILFDAIIEQLKSLTTLKVSFLMQRDAVMNIDEHASLEGNSCSNLLTSNNATIYHINLIKKLDFLSND